LSAPIRMPASAQPNERAVPRMSTAKKREHWQRAGLPAAAKEHQPRCHPTGADPV
jgi:hypothetical protein